MDDPGFIVCTVFRMYVRRREEIGPGVRHQMPVEFVLYTGLERGLIPGYQDIEGTSTTVEGKQTSFKSVC